MAVYRLSHRTTYTYEESVSVCHNVAHLRPRAAPRHTWRRFELLVSPEPAALSERADYFGNTQTVFAIQETHKRLDVLASGEVEVEPFGAVPHGPAWEAAAATLSGPARLQHWEALQYLYPSPHASGGEEVTSYAMESFVPGRPVATAAVELAHRIHEDFTYDSTATTVATPLEEVMRLRRGVCQDFAHLTVACLRSVGLAARYVSGYLLTLPPPGRPRLVGADASHAWASVYVPGLHGEASTWLDLDPTNDLVPSDRHVAIAWGRDFGDVSPLRGVILAGGRHAVHVSVDLVPIECG